MIKLSAVQQIVVDTLRNGGFLADEDGYACLYSHGYNMARNYCWKNPDWIHVRKNTIKALTRRNVIQRVAFPLDVLAQSKSLDADLLPIAVKITENLKRFNLLYSLRNGGLLGYYELTR